jgi:hypothetical protein
MDAQRKQELTRYRHRSGATHQQPVVKGMAREQYWPSTLMGLGIFVGLVSFFTVVYWTLIAPDLLFRLFLVLCFVGNLLPYMRSGLWLGMERLEWFLFNLLSVGPLGTSLLLWLNFLGHGPVSESDHSVATVDVGRTVITYYFADDHLREFPFARSVYSDSGEVIGSTIRISQADGFLGIPVILRKEPVPSRL